VLKYLQTTENGAFMKKILLTLAFLLLINSGNYSCTTVLAEENVPVIEATVEYDWVNMLQLQRDEKIKTYHDILFNVIENNKRTKKEFRGQYRDFLKDKDHIDHYRIISSGRKETDEENLSGFFTKFRGQEILYSYAIQAKKDLRHVYYYSARGNLAYVDEISENYPNFPYHSRQYRSNGKLAGTIYFETRDIQYVYAPNGKFKGIWYKDRMYDAQGKELMTRTNW
jgi:hypothetical protein